MKAKRLITIAVSLAGIVGVFYFVMSRKSAKLVTDLPIAEVAGQPGQTEVVRAPPIPFAEQEAGVEVIREGGVATPSQSLASAQNTSWGPLSVAESTLFSNRLDKMMDEYKDRPRKLGAQFMGLANRGNSIDLHLIMAFLDTPSGGIPAIEALGYVENVNARPELSLLLKGKMDSGNIPISVAAVKSYARIQGDDAIPDIEGFITRGWLSQNGCELDLCVAGVKALGEIRTPAGVVALISQLREAGSPGWLPDFGSEVVATLDQWAPPSVTAGRVPREEIRRALLSYAEVLRRKMPGPENEPGRVYYEQKIQEALSAAGRVSAPALSPVPL